jgi:hypothetical protein
MTRSLALLSILAIACNEEGFEPESSDATDAQSSLEDSDEESILFEPEEGLQGDGEVFDPNEIPEWVPAQMRSGAYWMSVLDVIEDNAEVPMEPGWGVDVWAPYVGGVVLLWGYAPLETDGEYLRADGILEIPHDELDCTLLIETVASGEPAEDDRAFFLEVYESTETFGADCEALGMTEGLIERFYLADFEWMEPQEEAEGVDAE